MKTRAQIQAALTGLLVMSKHYALDDERQDGQREGTIEALRWALGEANGLDKQLDYIEATLSTLSPDS